MKTEAQMARMELEFRALDAAFSTMRYLRFGPQHNTWQQYCEKLSSQIFIELKTEEFYYNNPDYKFG